MARSSIGVKESSVRPATCGPVAVLALVAALTGACSTLKVGSDFDHAASFSGYRTYSWLPRERRGNSNPLTVQRARDAIDSELIAKGFHEASDPQAADFVVDFTIGSHERTDVESYPAAYAGPWWGVRGWWGGPYWGDTIDVRQYREGVLSIDMFDQRTHRPVWHGWAKKELSRSDIENSAAPISNAVRTILQAFPPH